MAPICDEFRVPYFAHIGNNSQSEQYKAGKRFAGLFDQGLIPMVLHLADHDPNGIDMTRDNTERLALYARHEVEVRRIALNIDQVRPTTRRRTSPRKPTAAMRPMSEQFGEECWELDALSPTVIADLIRAEIEAMIDASAKWRKCEAAEHRNRALLGRVSEIGPRSKRRWRDERLPLH